MKLNLQYENGTIEEDASGEIDVSHDSQVEFINVELTSDDKSGMNLFVSECKLKMQEFENVTNIDAMQTSKSAILIDNGCLTSAAKKTNLYDLLEKTENGRESLTIQPYDYNPNWETGDKRKLKIICEVRLCSKLGPDAPGCQVTETCKNERPYSFLDQVIGRKRRQADVSLPPAAVTLETEV